MTAEWFKCGEHIRALAEAAEREDRKPSVAGSNPRTATNPSLWDRRRRRLGRQEPSWKRANSTR